jgi:hypothetical protein
LPKHSQDGKPRGSQPLILYKEHRTYAHGTTIWPYQKACGSHPP